MKMKKGERLAEYAQHLIETAQQKPTKLKESYSPSTKSKSIHQKLLDVYVEESNKETSCKRLRCCSRLLDKLVKKEHLNTLIVNLYPGNEGYSLMLRGRNGADSETIRLPYEENDLLEYLDAEELPPILVDLLDKSQANIFYSGCVIAEVRDYRRMTNGSFDTQYVLLKPTPHSLLCDINSITNDGHRWTQEDRYCLESQLLIATQEPLCLDPSPAVFLANNFLQFERLKLNSQALKRSVKKFTQASVNRKRKFAQCPAPRHLKLHDFIEKHKEKSKMAPPVNQKNVDMWKMKEYPLSVPDEIDVPKYAQPRDKPKITLDNTPVTIEEYILETDRCQGKASYTKLTIQQRMTDEFYIGHLYVDRDFVEGHTNGSTCRFPLGTRRNTDKYIRQFTEIFTEEGRRQVKITHFVPGKEPVVRYTQLPPVATSTITSAASTTSAPALSPQQPLITQATNLAAQIVAQDKLASIGVKKTQMKLSLSIGGQSGSMSTLKSPAKSPAESPNSSLGLPGSLPVTPTGSHKSRHSVSSKRPPSAPNPALLSPTASQLPTYSQATGLLSPVAGKLHPASTPPPLGARTPGSRRGSLQDAPSAAAQLTRMSQSIQQAAGQQLGSHSAPATPNTTLPSGSVGNVLNLSSTSSSSSLTQTTNVIAPNVNIANLSGMPPNINIQNLTGLPGMGLSSLSGLQNLPNAATGIAVPVSLSMLSSSSSTSSSGVINTPAGIFVGSLTTGLAVSTSGSTTTTNSQSGASTSQPAFVTMVTAIPPGTTASSTSGSSMSTVTTGLLATPNTVLTSVNASSMVQLPLGLQGNLTQLMGLKGTQGIRPGAPLSLVQIQGQQNAPLLLAGLPRPGLAAGQVLPAGGQSIKPGGQASGSGSKSKSTSLSGQQLLKLSSHPPGLSQPPLHQPIINPPRESYPPPKGRHTSKKRKHKS